MEIRDHRGLPVLSGEFRSRVDMLGNIEKDAALKNRDGRTVIGEVELEIPEPTRENRRPELEVDIQVSRPARRLPSSSTTRPSPHSSPMIEEALIGSCRRARSRLRSYLTRSSE